MTQSSTHEPLCEMLKYVSSSHSLPWTVCKCLIFGLALFLTTNCVYLTMETVETNFSDIIS